MEHERENSHQESFHYNTFIRLHPLHNYYLLNSITTQHLLSFLVPIVQPKSIRPDYRLRVCLLSYSPNQDIFEKASALYDYAWTRARF